MPRSNTEGLTEDAPHRMKTWMGHFRAFAWRPGDNGATERTDSRYCSVIQERLRVLSSNLFFGWLACCIRNAYCRTTFRSGPDIAAGLPAVQGRLLDRTRCALETGNTSRDITQVSRSVLAPRREEPGGRDENKLSEDLNPYNGARCRHYRDGPGGPQD